MSVAIGALGSSNTIDTIACSQCLHTVHTHTHTRLTALCLWLPGWAGTRKAKPIWILLEQEIVSGSGISWAVCKSAPCSRQITMPALHHSVFYRPDAVPAAQPTASKHWRHYMPQYNQTNTVKPLQFACTSFREPNKAAKLKGVNIEIIPMLIGTDVGNMRLAHH